MQSYSWHWSFSYWTSSKVITTAFWIFFAYSIWCKCCKRKPGGPCQPNSHTLHLSPLSKAIPQHSTHRYTAQMPKKSEVVVHDVLMKNEAKYRAEGYPKDRRVASGWSAYLRIKREHNAIWCVAIPQKKTRLELLEPHCEDWHCMVCVLMGCWIWVSGNEAIHRKTKVIRVVLPLQFL